MIEVPQDLTPLLLPGLNILWQVTVIASFALLVSRCLNRKAMIQHWILLTALCLIVLSPVTVYFGQKCGFGIFSLPIPEVDFHMSDLRTGPDLPVIVQGTEFGNGTLSSSFSGTGSGSENNSAANHEEMKRFGLWRFSIQLVSFLAVCWSPIVLLQFVRLISGYWKLTKLLKEALPIDAEWDPVILEAREAAGMHKAVKVLQSPEIETPVAVGFFRPKVIIPRRLPRHLTPAEIRQILIHEFAHILRRDQLVVFLQLLVETVFWFHPLVHMLNRQLARIREEICDNYVLNSTGVADYSRMLLRMAEMIGCERSFPTAVALLTSQWKLENRVAGILDDRRELTTRVRKSEFLFVSSFTALAICIGLATTFEIKRVESEDKSKNDELPANRETGGIDLPEGEMGLAAGYPGDQDIANHPAVLFADDFETYSSVGDLEKGWNAVYGNNVALSNGTGPSMKKGQSLELSVPLTKGIRKGGGVAKKIDELPDILFLRWYQKLESGWDVPPHWFENGAAISSSYFTETASPGAASNGRNKFLVGVGNVNMLDRNPGLLAAALYYPEQRQRWGDYFLPNGRIYPGGDTAGGTFFGEEFKERPNFTPEPGRWYCYETMVKANTPGKKDGRVAVWIDGTLKADFPNLRVRDIPGLRIDRFDIILFATNNPKRIHRKWHDNIVAATSYIGPIRKSGE